MMKIFCVFTLALGALATTSERAIIELEGKNDASKWAKLHLNPAGELEITASNCVDTSNFCDGYKFAQDTCTSSDVDTVEASLILRHAGSTLEAKIELYSNGRLAFTVDSPENDAQPGCVNPSAGTKESYDISAIVLDNEGTKGSIEFDHTSTRKKLNFHTANVHTGLQPSCICHNGTAATDTCSAYGDHHCVSCDAKHHVDPNDSKKCRWNDAVGPVNHWDRMGCHDVTLTGSDSEKEQQCEAGGCLWGCLNDDHSNKCNPGDTDPARRDAFCYVQSSHQCAIHGSDRVDCNGDAVTLNDSDSEDARQSACETAGCCWQPSEHLQDSGTRSTPWCFRKREQMCHGAGKPQNTAIDSPDDDQCGTECSGGTHHIDPSSNSCKAHTNCAAANKVADVTGTSANDAQCGECADGYTDVGTDVCAQLCTVGTSGTPGTIACSSFGGTVGGTHPDSGGTCTCTCNAYFSGADCSSPTGPHDHLGGASGNRRQDKVGCDVALTGSDSQKKQQCESAGCLFEALSYNSNDPQSYDPWCYHKFVDECAVDGADREDAAVSLPSNCDTNPAPCAQACRNANACWQRTTWGSNRPWCFNKNN